ncbi:MAG TPA: hypothetical protein VJN93_06250 [Candidatus Acidoferrum sp.]|nr:hypothetical protein [Candidatus Acidoferrum sp.]
MNFLIVAVLCFSFGPQPAAQAPTAKLTWKPIQFAIVRFNDEAPQAWNIYHAEKHESLLIKLWKRYLLMDLKEQEIYDVDPQTVKADGENVQWSFSDLPKDPVETSEWKVRDAGLVERIRFRFGTTGHFVDIELPLKPNGKIAY